MNLKKVINALQNTRQIKDGIINTIFKKDEVEEIAKARFNICKNCPHMDKSGDHCMAPGTQPCCSLCGCSLKLKTRSLDSECPAGNWLAVEEKQNQ